jgi:DNA-binding PadR family transcriptional regulator
MSTSRNLPRTPLALVVLALLKEHPMHPYQMKVRMRERGHEHIVRVKGASLYDTVERLNAAGLIEPQETSREGRRPERTTYAITDVGDAELDRWVRELIAVPVPEYPQFVVGLAFLMSIGVDRHSGLRPEGRAEAIELFGRRAVALEAEISEWDAMLSSVHVVGVLPIFIIEGEYAQAMRRAELDWVRGLIRRLEGEDLWPDAETLDRVGEAERQRLEEQEVPEGTR